MKAAARFLLGCLSVFALVAIAQVIPFGAVFNTGAASCGSPVSTNLAAWYSADCITLSGGVCSFPANNATFLSGSVWSDRSANANNMQADASFHGCVFKTALINGLPAMNFPNNCGFAFNAQPDSGATSWTVFVVFQNSSTSYKGDFTGGFTFSGASGTFKHWTGSTVQQGIDKANLVGVANGNASQGTGWHQMSAQFQNQSAGNTAVLRIDRGSDGPASFTSANVTAGLHFVGIGHESGTYQEALNGNLAEILIYAGTGTLLSGGDVTTNETYLNCRYGL